MAKSRRDDTCIHGSRPARAARGRDATAPLGWFRSRSALSYPVKKPADPALAGYFYTGLTRRFQTAPPRKKGRH